MPRGRSVEVRIRPADVLVGQALGAEHKRLTSAYEYQRDKGCRD